MKNLIYILSLLLISCSTELDYKFSGYSEKIVVEGVIESGSYPRVFLSLNVPMSVEPDSLNYLDYIIRYAKVTVSDGVNSEVLTSGWNKNSLPPFLYKGTSIKGVAGQTYTLKVEYGGYTLYSITTVPQASELETFIATETSFDSLKMLSVLMNITPKKATSFRIFTRKNSQSSFEECPILYNADFSTQGIARWQILPGMLQFKGGDAPEALFKTGDTVRIKICEIDSASTLFFKDLDAFSSNGIGKLNLIGEHKQVHSNITAPGTGIWWGAAVKNYTLVIP